MSKAKQNDVTSAHHDVIEKLVRRPKTCGRHTLRISGGSSTARKPRPLGHVATGRHQHNGYDPDEPLLPERELFLRYRHVYAGKGGWFGCHFAQFRQMYGSCSCRGASKVAATRGQQNEGLAAVRHDVDRNDAGRDSSVVADLSSIHVRGESVKVKDAEVGSPGTWRPYSCITDRTKSGPPPPRREQKRPLTARTNINRTTLKLGSESRTRGNFGYAKRQTADWCHLAKENATTENARMTNYTGEETTDVISHRVDDGSDGERSQERSGADETPSEDGVSGTSCQQHEIPDLTTAVESMTTKFGSVDDTDTDDKERISTGNNEPEAETSKTKDFRFEEPSAEDDAMAVQRSRMKASSKKSHVLVSNEARQAVAEARQETSEIRAGNVERTKESCSHKDGGVDEDQQRYRRDNEYHRMNEQEMAMSFNGGNQQKIDKVGAVKVASQSTATADVRVRDVNAGCSGSTDDEADAEGFERRTAETLLTLSDAVDVVDKCYVWTDKYS